MKNQVTLKLHGIQAEGEIVEVDTEAEYSMEEGFHVVKYVEVPKESCVATETVLRFKEGSLTILKKGEVNSKMEFEEGKTKKSDYVTPYMTFKMETVTEKLLFKIEENRIEAFVKYELMIDGGKVSDSEVRFLVMS